MTFASFALDQRIQAGVERAGYTVPTPIQTQAIPPLLTGRDILGLAQTGTGKTAAFVLPILQKLLTLNAPKHGPVKVLVLAPTRELALQIHENFEALGQDTGISSAAVFGGVSQHPQVTRLRRSTVVVACPGRLLDLMNQGLAKLDHVDTLVLDEADRMLDMGFIPEVKRIIRETPPKNHRRTMLFSATLTEDVLRLASQWMPDPVICEIEPEHVAVETVDQIVYITTTRDKFKLLYNILKKRGDDRTLIFCNRRDHSQTLVNKLKKHGVACELLSGAVPQKKRLRILEDFRGGEIQVVVATDVAGRGLHVKDIGLVVNYEFPYEAEDYVHRIGRTGRAGVAGTAISFACEDESFIIPDIEKYLGNPLRCTMPDEELLARVPPAR